jgi:hypothetical protein
MEVNVDAGFELETQELKLKDILPLRRIYPYMRMTIKYRQIKTSIQKIGLVEYPVVTRKRDSEGKALLLDGHFRIDILKKLGVSSTVCLIGTGEEAFTYNSKICRLAPVQQRSMILEAIANGVSEKRIAKVLNLDIASIRFRVRLTDGICEKAVHLLQDKNCPLKLFKVLKQMKPDRQVQVAELMNSVNNYSIPYANALLTATSEEELVVGGEKNRFLKVSSALSKKMSLELEGLQSRIATVEKSYGGDHLNLVIISNFVASLLSKPGTFSYMARNHPEILAEFHKITDAVSLGNRSLD